LYWAFFVLPLIGIRFPPLEVGVLVLGLVGGAYASEAVRGALLAVDRGQWEAGLSLSMSRSSTVLRIVLPQAIPTMLPIFQNVAIDMLKGTSLLSLVTVTELTRTANELGTVGVMSFSSGYGALLVIYFLLSLPIMAGMAKLEKYTARYQSKFVRRPRS
jgi:polar amino acid transport system permease protein